MRDNIFYDICYDAVLSLAYALEKVIENKGISTLLTNCVHCQCMKNIYSGNISLLISEQLRNTDFIGSSVSIAI